MKIIIISLLLLPSLAFAQGGIGNKPRTDIVMLSQVIRDSLSDQVFQNIMDLKRMAEINQFDSAAPMIAFEDSTKAWARAANPSDSAERESVAGELAKIKKLFDDFPEAHPMYFAVFKTNDTPSGEKDLYQISMVNGKKKRMISWVFYPIGDKLLLGSF
ncbi:MAG TPA: hypothetical protein VFD13_06150 [Candidatus Kapabacteria bacterium]|nr:hypothetical protein [Candidatus Kapabacteria bacterium]